MTPMTESVQRIFDEFHPHPGASGPDPGANQESNFDLAVVREGGVLYVLVRGDLEFHHIRRFDEALHEDLANPDCKQVVIEMREVPFVDTTGLASLVDIRNTMRERGGAVHLAACTPFVLKTLEVARLKRIFVLHETFQDACDAVTGTPEVA